MAEVEWRESANGSNGYIGEEVVLRVDREYLYRAYRFRPRCWKYKEVNDRLRGTEYATAPGYGPPRAQADAQAAAERAFREYLGEG